MTAKVDLFEHFQRQVGEWLIGRGPESDIVVSTRVRLARNLAEHVFLTKAKPQQRADIEALLRERLQRADLRDHLDAGSGDPVVYQGLEDIGSLERLCLVERHLISRDLAGAEGGGVAISPRETVSIMVNEEDHLRIQVLRSGFQPEQGWQLASGLDDRIEGVVNYAFHSQFGYLTACPTNCGTGLRVSVMVHLPALVMTKQIDKVFQAVGKINLAVRGFYGEGTQAFGDFYQISNQATLGRGEEDILKQLADVVPQIVRYERAIRDTLVAENRVMLEDRICRALSMLQSARTITSEETMDLLSAVRMGVHLRLIEGLPIGTVNELFINTQPAHLQRREGKRLESAERDIARATYIRETLKSVAS